MVNGQTGEIIIGANKKITKTLLRKLAESYDSVEIDPSPIRNKIFDIIATFEQKFATCRSSKTGCRWTSC